MLSPGRVAVPPRGSGGESGFCQISGPLTGSEHVRRGRRRSGGLQAFRQDAETPRVHEPVSSQRDVLIAGDYRPEKNAQLIMGTAEACRRGEAREAEHGMHALFDVAMVLLEVIVEVLTCAMRHVLTKLTGNSTGV